ncbi:hypothetical protein J7K07_09020 [Candidatus Bathyarchaeota archaeon]|nr:hypothetical protein [Candidatus Bathyarchaeota archaeon]
MKMYLGVSLFRWISKKRYEALLKEKSALEDQLTLYRNRLDEAIKVQNETLRRLKNLKYERDKLSSERDELVEQINEMKKSLKHLNNRLEEVIKERDYLKSKVTLKGSHSRYLSNNKRIVAYFRGEKLTIISSE